MLILSYINLDLHTVPQELEPRAAAPPDSTLVFSPQSRVQLKTAVNACVKLSPKGECSTGNPDLIPTTSPKPDELVVALREELAALKHAREQERKGRINAERALRQVSQQQAERDGYLFRPIGIVRSCFPDRRGTPRQPTLCPVVQNERMHCMQLVTWWIMGECILVHQFIPSICTFILC